MTRKAESSNKQLERQAKWTEDLRSSLYRRAGIRTRKKILDVGCGTGIIANELAQRSGNSVTGIDINSERISKAQKLYPDVDFQVTDALKTGFESSSFDLIVSSFLWLWINEKETLANEIKRLLKPSGVYISLAEFDYEARIDYPEPLMKKKDLYIQLIKQDGGDPFAARQLPNLFNDSNLNTTWGASCSAFRELHLIEDFEKDWQHIKEHLAQESFSQNLQDIYILEKKFLKNKTRFVFMPVFWLYSVRSG